MRRPSRKGLSLAFVLCANIPLMAQNLQSIGREKPFSLAGGVSFNQIFYASDGVTSRRDPYSYYATGTLNLALYGWSVPLSFSVSNTNTTFTQPFNQYALHPTWKWITAHAGYTSMSFSPYTVNGHIFVGGGVELTPPGKWKISALYGRFLKAVAPDTAGASPATSFQRNGYGLKATFGNGGNFIDLIAFHAADDQNSIVSLPDSLGITPHENLVLSLGAGKTLFKHLLLKTELATSALTKDTRADKTTFGHPLAQTPLFQPRLSTSYYQAFKTACDYQRGEWRFGLTYERIDPGYQTLGAYYFTNDLENIAANASAGILQGKMNIAASAGLQHDNLAKDKVSSMRRMVGSYNITYTPSERLQLAASWSSFQTYTNIRSRFESLHQLTPYEYPDTLNFTQISTNASLSGMWTTPGDGTRRQHINFHFTCQDAADRQGQVAEHSGTTFYNLNAGYAMTLVPQNTSITLAFNTTINDGSHIRSRTLGPNAAISRSFNNRKLRTTFSGSWNRAYGNGTLTSTVINARVNGVLSIHNKHNINLSAVMVSRSPARESTARAFTEFTATLGYSYSFATRK